MRMLLFAATLVLMTGCVPGLVKSNDSLPVQARDDLVLPESDTTLTGTITMLSPKLQALDVVQIIGDTAFRKGRLLFDSSIAPYYGGIIQVSVRPLERGVSGYMLSVQLLDWTEYPVQRELTNNLLQRLLQQQSVRLERLLNDAGFDDLDDWGQLQLEGYDPDRRICIWSMVGGAVIKEGIIEKKPLLIVWSTPEGRLKKVTFGVTGQLLERR